MSTDILTSVPDGELIARVLDLLHLVRPGASAVDGAEWARGNRLPTLGLGELKQIAVELINLEEYAAELAAAAEQRHRDATVPRPLETYRESLGAVIWFAWSPDGTTALYCGTPIDAGWPGERFTHWLPLPADETVKNLATLGA